MLNPFKEPIDEVLAEIELLRANQEELKKTPGTEGRQRMIQKALYPLQEELAHLDIATLDAREIAQEIADHEERLSALKDLPEEQQACQEIQRTLTDLRARLRRLTGGKPGES